MRLFRPALFDGEGFKLEGDFVTFFPESRLPSDFGGMVDY
jgi:hypothetical protein